MAECGVRDTPPTESSEFVPDFEQSPGGDKVQSEDETPRRNVCNTIVALVPTDGSNETQLDPRKMRLCGALSYLRYECVTVSPPPKRTDTSDLPRTTKHVASCAQAIHEMLNAPNGQSPLQYGDEQWVICILRPVSILPLACASRVVDYLAKEASDSVLISSLVDDSTGAATTDLSSTVIAGKATAVRDALVIMARKGFSHGSQVGAALPEGSFTCGTRSPLCVVVSALSQLQPALPEESTGRGNSDTVPAPGSGDAASRAPPALALRDRPDILPHFIAFTSNASNRKESLEQLWDALYETGMNRSSTEDGASRVSSNTQTRSKTRRNFAAAAPVSEDIEFTYSASSTRTKRAIAQRKARHGSGAAPRPSKEKQPGKKKRSESRERITREEEEALRAQLPVSQKALAQRTRQLMILEPDSRQARVAIRALRKLAPSEARHIETMSTAWRSGIPVKQRETRMFLRQAAIDRLRPAISQHNRDLERNLKDVSNRKYYRRRDRARSSKSARLRAHADSMDQGTRGRWSDTRLHDVQKRKPTGYA